MKHVLLTILLTLPAYFAAVAQTELVYTVNNWNGDGITQHTIDPSTGTVSASVNYANGSPTSSTAIALNSSNYLYFIPEILNNNGDFSVYSIAANTSATTPTLVLSGSIPGSPSNVLFRRIGINEDGVAYMISSEEGTNTIHLSRFVTTATGGANTFEYLGTMSLSDGPTSNFYNGDIAFDGNGDAFILANADVDNGVTKIYKVSGATLDAATSSSVTPLTYMATVLTPSGSNFAQAVTGLAFSNTGNLYVTSQDVGDPSGGGASGIFMLNRDQLAGPVVATATNVTSNGIGDITSNYYPTINILPVSYNYIKAKMINNALVVDWQTATEKNNVRFDIEVSKDGKNFVKIGTVNTKALNGNSNNNLTYDFSTPVQNSMAALGISIFSLAFVLLMFNRRNKMLFSLMLLFGVTTFTISCNKNSEQIDTADTEKIFVRIAQVDENKKVNYSEIVTAYKAD